MSSAPPHIFLPSPLLPARFVARPNRFIVEARLDGVAGGGAVRAHLPDPGRLSDLLLPERRLWLEPAPAGRGRRTAWTAVVAEVPGGERVSLDTRLPNRLVAAALTAEALPELAPFRLERPEFRLGRSRFDFLLADGRGRRLLLEVKSVSMVEGDCALFPDAVTARGARHVSELGELAASGRWQTAVLFVVQRADARRVEAARQIDPAFADALATARARGLAVLARSCRVGTDRITLGEPLSVRSGSGCSGPGAIGSAL